MCTVLHARPVAATLGARSIAYWAHPDFFIIFLFLHEPQSLTMYYIRDERGDEALPLCRPMGLGFPAVRTRQEGKDKRYEKQ